jgi:hypothetical protein
MRPLAEFIQLLRSRRIGQVAYVRSHDATLGFVIAGVGRHRRVSEGGGRAAELALLPAPVLRADRYATPYPRR